MSASHVSTLSLGEQQNVTGCNPSLMESARSMSPSYTLGLNPAQLKAVDHDPGIPLQILAGPGSGKTKVLTSRIARLILTHNLSPGSICAVTFTNKAANEMRDRLNKLIGKTKTTALQMGTFHSLCAKFLRRHSRIVDLDPNFTVCDADDSKKLLSALMKPYAEYMAANDIVLTHGSAASIISQAKAKGKSAAMYFEEIEDKENLAHKKLAHRQDPGQPKTMLRILAEVYIGYEKILKDNNALDFDDLLIYGVKLFSNHKEAVAWCAHILVDEFQDTNTMQYELMKAIGFRRCVTIVGDPDQSIYGWRSAEVINLSRMRKDFPNTEQIFLEQNYRSTAAILRACLGIVSEDKNRIPKTLHTSHPLGVTPVVSQFTEQKDETTFMAQEIKRCVANMGGTLRWSDFVILLRYNALSRPIESALQLAGIPCKILGGHKFFERMEVKDILSYLQVVDNPSFNPALVRAVKIPSRGMGDKSLAELEEQAQKHQISQLELLERIHDHKVPDIKPPIKKKISAFVHVIRKLRQLAKENCSPSLLIAKLVELINYEEHLRKTQPDWDSRWENVQELITFATEVEAEAAKKNTQSAEETEQPPSVLREFLQASCLSSEGDNDSAENNDKVTLSTCHAAKGLEWPVVMVPSVDSDTFPFYRTTDVDEERRLLYVACTRAQSLLYLMFAKARVVGGKMQNKQLSKFVSAVSHKNPGFFTPEVPRFSANDRTVICNVLSRPIPDQAEVDKRVAELKIDDFILPNYPNGNGEWQTGEKSSNHGISDSGLNHLYASPDTLAALSANFQKDFKKAPFSKTSRYTGTGSTPNALGEKQQRYSATRHVRNESEALPLSFSSAATVIASDSLAALPPSNAGLALGRNSRASEIHSAPSTSTSTLGSFRVAPPSGTSAKGKGGLPVHAKVKNLYSSSSLDSSKLKRHSKLGQSVDIIEIDDSDNEHENVHPNPAVTLTSALHISKTKKGPTSMGSKSSSLDTPVYNQMRPPGESSKPKLSVSLKANVVLDEFEIVDDDVDFYMNVDKDNGASNYSTAAARIVPSTLTRRLTTGTSKLPQQLKTTTPDPNSSRLVGSGQPLLSTLHGTTMVMKDEVENSSSSATTPGVSTLAMSTSSYSNSFPKTTAIVAAAAADPAVPPPMSTSDTSNNSSSSSSPLAPVLQPVAGAGPNGVKRRLGMGRITVGYSNKKFKRPV